MIAGVPITYLRFFMELLLLFFLVINSSHFFYFMMDITSLMEVFSVPYALHISVAINMSH